jgi:hypothetical protein
VRVALQLDLLNPFQGGNATSEDRWWRSFTTLLPAAAMGLTASGSTPFDRLDAKGMPVAAPLKISVIVTCFRPDAGLVTALRSLIGQTWGNIEILLIDDGSPAEYDDVLRDAAGMDERISLTKLTTNAGTYAARNIGLDLATGDLVTFQDSDDWSHPRRLELQAVPLINRAGPVATISDALRVSERLTLTRPGRNPQVMNTSSLMFRRGEVLARVGYFDRLRKAADSEFLRRVEAAFGTQALKRLEGQNLALIRQAPGSLSRAEIRAGWMDPKRLAYRSAYMLWHKGCDAEGVAAHLSSAPSSRPFTAPPELLIDPELPEGARQLDVLFVGDWRSPGQSLDEIQALVKGGRRVGLLHLESFANMTRKRDWICEPLQRLINDALVVEVLLAQEATAEVVVVRDPSVLQFAAAGQSAIAARHTVLIHGGDENLYTATVVSENARALFGATPVWVGETQLPQAVDLDAWPAPREGLRATVPIVGRFSIDSWGLPDKESEQPADPFLELGEADIRLHVVPELARRWRRSLPPGWVVFGADEVEASAFISQLDFLMCFPQPEAMAQAQRLVATALAAGCVAILPRELSAVFGDGAVYCEPGEVAAVVRKLHGDPKEFIAQSLRARSVAQEHGYEAYARSLLAAPLSATESD